MVFLDGEHSTEETQSWWEFKVEIQWPKAFQTLIVLSLEAETNCLTVLEIETDITSPWWPSNLVTVWPVATDHNLKVLSQEPESAYWPSGVNWQSWTMWEWPLKAFFAIPYWFSSLVNCQTIKVLSLEPDNNKSGFAAQVEREVTQPLWPSKVPLKTKTSELLDILLLKGESKENPSTLCEKLTLLLYIFFSSTLWKECVSWTSTNKKKRFLQGKLLWGFLLQTVHVLRARVSYLSPSVSPFPLFFFPEVDGLNGNMNLREPEVAVLGNTLEGADTTTVAIIEQFQY